jgi:uncharacterized protein YndB with AHSA1/START domain
MPDIEHALRLQAPPERVWPALATASGLAGWWTLGETRLAGDPGKLGPFTFQSRAVVTHLEVTRLDPPRHVAWRATHSNAPGGWDGTVITFDLVPENGETRLDFAHRGFAEANDGYRKVLAGWAHYLQTLKHVIEPGAATATGANAPQKAP